MQTNEAKNAIIHYRRSANGTLAEVETCRHHASGFTGDELSWPSTWIDRLGRDRTPSIPGHELAGRALGTGGHETYASAALGLRLPRRAIRYHSEPRRLARYGRW